MTGGLKMGVNVAAHTRHIFLGSAPPPPARGRVVVQKWVNKEVGVTHAIPKTKQNRTKAK